MNEDSKDQSSTREVALYLDTHAQDYTSTILSPYQISRSYRITFKNDKNSKDKSKSKVQ